MLCRRGWDRGLQLQLQEIYKSSNAAIAAEQLLRLSAQQNRHLGHLVWSCSGVRSCNCNCQLAVEKWQLNLLMYRNMGMLRHVKFSPGAGAWSSCVAREKRQSSSRWLAMETKLHLLALLLGTEHPAQQKTSLQFHCSFAVAQLQLPLAGSVLISCCFLA